MEIVGRTEKNEEISCGGFVLDSADGRTDQLFCQNIPKNDSDAAVSCFREPQYKLKGEGRQTLVLWSQEPEAERVYIQRAIKNFEEATGNRVKVKSYPKEEFQKTDQAGLCRKAKEARPASDLWRDQH